MRYQSRGPRRRWMRPRGPKVCQFYADKLPTLTYKQVDVLRNFITSQGKIMPRRQTGCSAKNQRKITQIIKQARHMALLPFVAGENQN